MADHKDLVASIKALLEARGQTWRTNEDAFQITGRVAWALRHEGAQLIVKRPPQNGAVWHGVKYSHDAIAFPSGWIDCLVSAGPERNLNAPAWGATGTDMSATLADPFDLDAGIVVTPPVVVDPPPGPDPSVPPAGDGEVLAAVLALTRQVEHYRAELLGLREALGREWAAFEQRWENGLTGTATTSGWVSGRLAITVAPPPKGKNAP